MTVESTRFGTFEVEDGHVLTFPDGLPGLPGERYALVARDENQPFFWLHSVDHADVLDHYDSSFVRGDFVDVILANTWPE